MASCSSSQQAHVDSGQRAKARKNVHVYVYVYEKVVASQPSRVTSTVCWGKFWRSDVWIGTPGIWTMCRAGSLCISFRT